MYIHHQESPSIDGAFVRPIAALSAGAHRLRFVALAAFAVLCVLGGLAGSALAQGTPTPAGEVPPDLAPPADAVLLFELGARGVQIYTCAAKPDDASAFVWTFKAPEADLINRRDEVVGHHFAGPTWQGLDGSAAVGAVLARAAAPDAGAIPWLLLEVTERTGSGVFSTITYVQRLATTGGVAPAAGCDADHAGAETRQPYAATYAFYYATAPAA